MDKSPEVYNLFEFGQLDDIFVPVRNTARVKYTCFDVSKHFLVVGANSGSLYMFSRSPLRYLQTFSNKEGALIQLRIDPNERYLSFATNKGIVALLEHNIRETNNAGRSNTHTVSPRYIQVSHEHQGKTISCLQWNECGTRLFIADHSGKVTSLNVLSKKAKTLFQSSTSLIVTLTSQAVQMDFSQDKLLISTVTGCYLCDTAKEQYFQIGSKPRTGNFGACFYNNSYTQTPNIYAARPGSRLWEVDFEGSVLCTHQFKKSLLKPPTDIISVNEEYPLHRGHESTPSSFNFPQLLVVSGRFILTWVKERLFLFDPGSVSALLWTAFSNEILDIRTWSNDLYIWQSDGKLHNYQLLPVEQGISTLLSNSFWKLSAKLCIFYESVVVLTHVRTWLPKSSLEKLMLHLQEHNESELSAKIKELISRLREPDKSSPANQNGDCNQVLYPIESGIYVVNRPSDTQFQSVPLKCSSNDNLYKDKTIINGGNILRQVTNSATNLVAEKKKVDRSQINTSPTKNGILTEFLPNATSAQKANTNPSTTLSRINKTHSAADLNCIKENSNHKVSYDDMLYDYYTPYPLIMSVSGGIFWENDATEVFSSGMALLNPGAAFDELKNSLSSKYQSGKEQILCKIGLLEDHIKSRSAEDSTELLDVKRNITYNNSSGSNSQKPAEKSVVSNLKYSSRIKINLLPLYEMTEATWNVVSKSVLKDEQNLRELLEKWVECLLTTQEWTYNELQAQQVEMGNAHSGKNTHIISSMSQSVSCSTLVRLASTTDGNEPKYNVKSDWSDDANFSLSNGHRRQSCPNLMNMEDNSCCIVEEENDLTNGLINGQSNSLQLEDILWTQEVELLTNSSLFNSAKETSDYSCAKCYPNSFIIDPWESDKFIHKHMRDIAMLCFQTKTFGRLTDFCKYFSCFSRIEDLQQTDTLSKPVVESEETKYMWSESENERKNRIGDHARSIFVRQFFHLFEPKTIFQELHKDVAPSFKTWKAILAGVLQLHNINIELRHSHQELTPFYPLTQTLRMQPDSYPSIIKVLSSAPDISARDVLYLDQVISLHESTSLFMTYMEAVCLSRKLSGLTRRGLNPTSFGVSYAKMCEDPVVHKTWLKLLLKAGMPPKSQKTKCSCGNPRPWSHLYPWKRKDFIIHVMHLNPVNKQIACQLSKEFGFWIGYLQTCYKFISRQEEIFPTLIQLNDINILKDPFNIPLLPKTIAEWDRFIRLVIKHNQQGVGTCLFCNAKFNYENDRIALDGQQDYLLSFQNAVFLMLKYCSLDVVLKLLTDILAIHTEMKIPPSFYRQIILTATKRKLNSETFKQWDTKVASIAPQICAQLLMGPNTPRENQPLQVSTFKSSSFASTRCHWGISFDPSSLCNACCLPLMVSLATSSQGGIKLFPCSHGFHLQCITEEKCSICD